MKGAADIHGVALVLGEDGLLIRGPAGAGKTSLALELIARARAQGVFGRLVADDRVLLRARGGRLIASPHPAIAGRFEMRGIGIVAAPHLPEAVIRLVVDLDPSAPRMPEETREETLAGIRLAAWRMQREMVVSALSRPFGAFFVSSRLE